MWNRIQHVVIFSALLMPIDVSTFQSGISHWRNIRDETRFIQPEKDQPSYSVDQVREIVDNILLFQRTNGGWPKDYDMLAVLSESQRTIVEQTRSNDDTSYDNGNIHSQVEYLAQAYSQSAEPIWRTACERGFDFIIRSQYANGGFPQRFPNPKSFHAHITFNDGVMIGIVNVLQKASEGKSPFEWLDESRRNQAKEAVRLAVECILKCQILVEGKRTGWCQQHDQKAFEARPARTFELASICPQETTEIVRFLMQQPSPSPAIIEAVHDAVTWLRAVRLTGIRVDKTKANQETFLRHSADFDRIVVEDSQAPSLWARHYEIGTNRPIFAGRDGFKKYALAEIDRDRRTGSAWYGDWPRRLLDQEYAGWVVSLDAKSKRWRIGFGKTDVTPSEPVRLSGYGSREKVFDGIADRLSCRAMALSKSQQDSETMLLVSVDSIFITAELTSKIARGIEEQYGIPRSQFVLCSTHSHAAPHVAGGLTNLFQKALGEEELVTIERNTDRMIEKIKAAIELAMNDRQAGNLSLGGDQATFAVNRRVIKDGVWSGFGIQSDGPVDHRVRVLRATDTAGKLRGAVFMYACHCTTLGGDFNQVSGDWAGLAATELEKEYPGSTVLATIGCGADANPNPRTNYENAKSHASEIVAAVKRAFAKEMSPLNDFPVGHFGYAELAPELPTREHLRVLSTDSRAVNQRWSAAMTKIWNEKGRLPETYPAPIHTWQFGDDLTWVFLGGEVVVDYQMKLEKLLPGKSIWVAAYTDDVFAYVASERMRAEGGYEVDFSMIYYQQPGRWSSGTEELLLRRVREVLDDAPRNPILSGRVPNVRSLKAILDQSSQ